jgi:hypothetical protein
VHTAAERDAQSDDLAEGVPEDLYDNVVIPLNLTRPGTADVSS